MKPATRRLLLAAAVFIAWIGWLAYLAATATRPIVLSRPQFLVSTLDVIADVEPQDDKPGPVVTIREIAWPPNQHQELIGKPLTVTNLAECEGWSGPGSYILPLEKDVDHYRVAPLPRSPGFEPEAKKVQPRIYPATLQTRQQLEEIRKP